MRSTRPFRAPARTTVDDLAFAPCLAIFVAALAFAGLAGPGSPERTMPVVASSGHAPPAGTFTGTYVDGRPVYRLPAISVQASREVEMAGVATGDKSAPGRGRSDPRDRRG